MERKRLGQKHSWRCGGCNVCLKRSNAPVPALTGWNAPSFSASTKTSGASANEDPFQPVRRTTSTEQPMSFTTSFSTTSCDPLGQLEEDAMFKVAEVLKSDEEDEPKPDDLELLGQKNKRKRTRYVHFPRYFSRQSRVMWYFNEGRYKLCSGKLTWEKDCRSRRMEKSVWRDYANLMAILVATFRTLHSFESRIMGTMTDFLVCKTRSGLKLQHELQARCRGRRRRG